MRTPQHDALYSRFSAVPSMVAPEQALLFEACLRYVAGHPDFDKMAAEAEVQASHDEFWYSQDDWRSSYRPYVVKDGVLQIPVKGALLHNFPFAMGSWATGYIYIQKAFERGMTDPNVRGIAFMVHSGGGQVAGCFDAVDKMYAVKRQAKKPVRAFVSESGYSAAYAIISVADKRVVSRTGGVGSIGVVTMHVDISKSLEDYGVKITLISEAEGKTDGNPYEPLPDAVKARIQGDIRETYGVFVSTVARNMAMEEKVVRGLKSYTYTASEAVENGLADGIGSLDDAVASFVAELDNPDFGGDEMSKTEGTAVDQAAIDAARTEGHTAGKVEGVTEGKAQGATEERARVSAIMALDESKTRSAAALNIALTSDLSVEQAKALLATLPEDKAAAPAVTAPSPFAKAMEGENPNLGGGDDTSEPQAEDLGAITKAFALPGFRSSASK
jgi:ClpP class serine protease